MIYEQYFQLKQRPFSIAPNPQFLFQQGQYREALAALEYGLSHKGGFVLLTGEVGTGKTTLCKQLLKTVPDDTEVALILHPQLDRVEFLQAICRDFGIEQDFSARSEIQIIHIIHRFLLDVYAKGRHAVLVIDEAQHLDHSVLELVRLLTNLETNEEKLLQIILIGQPELKERLAKYELRQLNQRITVRFHLTPLTNKELKQYVSHRLHVASATGQAAKLFSTASLWLLHRLTHGIPRLVNVVADRALMAAYAENKKQVSAILLYKAAKEVLAEQHFKMPLFNAKALIGVSALSACFAFVLVYTMNGGVPDGTKLFNTEAVVDTMVAPFTASSSSQQDTGLNYGDLASTWMVSPREVCTAPRSCWQGALPSQLLMSASLDALVRHQGEWKKISEASNLPPLVETKIVWMPPFEFSKALKVGDRSEHLPWIQARLGMQSTNGTATFDDGAAAENWEVIQPDNAQGSLVQIGLPEFDWLLEEQVKQYQRSLGLKVDGVVGSQTILALWLSELAIQQAKVAGDL